jgi:hypothetical protein
VPGLEGVAAEPDDELEPELSVVTDAVERLVVA